MPKKIIRIKPKENCELRIFKIGSKIEFVSVFSASSLKPKKPIMGSSSKYPTPSNKDEINNNVSVNQHCEGELLQMSLT